MRWAAFDFETATSERTSACALGMVAVEHGEVVARQRWLIRPPGNRYSARNVAIHGIRPFETEFAREFADVWAEAQYVAGGRPLVAHNAAFDWSVVRAGCEEAGLEPPPVDVWCSVRIARRAWPDLGVWKLPAVAERAGAELDHHDALSDAAACSAVVAACIREAGATGLRHLGELLGIGPSYSAPELVPA